MTEGDVRYALAKQVPDMARGFTISTNYGDIVIEDGWLADRIQESTKGHIERMHQAIEKASRA